MATYPDDTKEETKTPIKALFYDVKTDFDGYCSDCAIDMPKGVKKKRHRFSKRICCVSCAEKIEAGSSKKPKADNDELRAIRMELKLVNRRFADLLDLVSRVADHFDIDLSNEEDETKQEEEEEECKNADWSMHYVITELKKDVEKNRFVPIGRIGN